MDATYEATDMTPRVRRPYNGLALSSPPRNVVTTLVVIPLP
jgi:hypothetical protein